MLLYIAATPQVVSIAIVVERTKEGKELPVQRPVYYLSEVLTLSKKNYPHYQKVTYGVYMAARKLKHYFGEHPIMVVSTTPLSEIIRCKDATGRVAKWAIELAAHTIQYNPRTTIKSQIIADFFADWGENQYLPPAPDSMYWRMNFDGSKMLGGWEPASSSPLPRGTSCSTYCTSTSMRRTTLPNTRPWCMGSSWPKRLAFGGSSALETPTWWCTRSQGNGTPRTQTWP
jgi:hypothetical protein